MKPGNRLKLGAKSRSAARRKAALADKEDQIDQNRLLVPSRRFLVLQTT
jgi:hypothetical protein